MGETLERRLYIGGLAENVDEYVLTKTFGKFGRISRLDYLFHRSGPLRGKPRDYAFVEYETASEASTALTETHNKLLRGKRIQVAFANASEYDSRETAGTYMFAVGQDGQRRRVRKPQSTRIKPTPLSLLKSSGKPISTDAKIRALEEKLKSLQEAKSVDDTGESSRKTVIPDSVHLPTKPLAGPGAFDEESGVGVKARAREGTILQSAEALQRMNARKSVL